ncbi:GNAT family N-acetyltransferase [Salinicola aestuarinus]|uniref:GNAT family N-acetyltransferase n=1 Tax=Salinicola aestuarinus TaxID=1949082 RepID=UPI000DA1A91A|nr:GNAT family N-acetyltransferase [Salinicola aestuarinus]
MAFRRADRSDYHRLTQIWEAATRSSHAFLETYEIAVLKPLIASAYLPMLELVVHLDDAGTVTGFYGVDGHQLEMLFIAPRCQGLGVGRALVSHAIATHGIERVDVNEQNTRAVGFYRHLGFECVSRSATDGQGRPFPILHLHRKRHPAPQAVGRSVRPS